MARKSLGVCHLSPKMQMSPTLHSLDRPCRGCLLAFGGTVCATTVVDSGFENQAVLHGIPHSFHQT